MILGERRPCAGCGERMGKNEERWAWTPDPDCPGFCGRKIPGTYGRGKCSRPAGHAEDCGEMGPDESVSAGLYWHEACCRASRAEARPGPIEVVCSGDLPEPEPLTHPSFEPREKPTVVCGSCREKVARADAVRTERPSGRKDWHCRDCATRKAARLAVADSSNG